MNKRWITMTASLSLLAVIQAQTVPTVKPAETQIEDILNVLNNMDIHLQRFDVSQFLCSTYQMEVYVDEYRNNQRTGRCHRFELGKNIGSLDDFPEESWPALREIHHLAEGETEWENIREISVYIQPKAKSDSTVYFYIASPKVGQQGFPFTLYPADGKDYYKYYTRPFALRATADDEMEIPLLIYGSAWNEPGTTIYRFCGANEIDPDMTTEMLKHIPHHYVIGLRLKKD